MSKVQNHPLLRPAIVKRIQQIRDDPWAQVSAPDNEDMWQGGSWEIQYRITRTPDPDGGKGFRFHLEKSVRGQWSDVFTTNDVGAVWVYMMLIALKAIDAGTIVGPGIWNLPPEMELVDVVETEEVLYPRILLFWHEGEGRAWFRQSLWREALTLAQLMADDRNLIQMDKDADNLDAEKLVTKYRSSDRIPLPTFASFSEWQRFQEGRKAKRVRDEEAYAARAALLRPTIWIPQTTYVTALAGSDDPAHRAAAEEHVEQMRELGQLEVSANRDVRAPRDPRADGLSLSGVAYLKFAWAKHVRGSSWKPDLRHHIAGVMALIELIKAGYVEVDGSKPNPYLIAKQPADTMVSL